MRILVVGTTGLYRHYGGGQVYVRTLVENLAGSSHDVEYLYLTFSTSSFPEVQQETVNGVLSRNLVAPNVRKNISTGQNDEAIEILAAAFRDIAPDIIHAHAWKDIAALAARKSGIPCVVTAHHGGIVCPAGALLNADGAICQIPASDTNCLKCCTKTVPGWRFWYPLIRTMPLKLRLRLGERLRRFPFILFLTPLGTISCNIRDKAKEVHNIGRNGDRVIAPSPAIADALVRNGIPEEKIRVIPHGIHLPQIQPMRSDLGVGPVRFLFVGRINHVKGVHVMLDAFADLLPEKYELHIVGGAVTAHEMRYLVQLKRKFASVNAVWHGSKPHEEIMQYVAWCDVMVHPTICLEVFGLTIAETLAVSRPVIASRCGGVEAQIHDGKNGLLVPPNDVVSLRKAIQSMIDDPARIKVMSEQCGDVVSIERHVKELINIYIEAVNDMTISRLAV